MLVAHESFFYIKLSSYRPASAPITRAFMLPVGSINIFVGLTDAVGSFDDSAHRAMLTTPLLTQAEYDQARSATLSLSGGGGLFDGSINNANESDALVDDADSINPSPNDRSIIATSFDGSITRTPSDWCPEDHSEALPYSKFESKGEIWEEPHVILMADSDPPPPDPFCTPIRTDAPAMEIETARKAMEEARAKEQWERKKIRLEKKTTTKISEYHQRRWQKKLATDMPTHTLNFNTLCQM
jgi:hypothetical protein